jgi:hypothetical protein
VSSSVVAVVRAAAALSLALLLAAAFAQPVETPAFVYTPPAGWKSNATARPITVTGPRKELLQLSVRMLPATGGLTEAAATRREVEATAVRAIEQLIKEERLTIARPAARRQLADGTAITELEARSADRQRTLAGFVVLGPRAAVLATLAIPGVPALTVTAVRQSLEAIRWR